MKKVSILSALLVLVMMLTSLTQADDGDMFRRNVSKTPLGETEKAAIYMMDFYVPAQSSAGVVGPVDNYLLADEATSGYTAREYAKPLVSVYIDGIAWEEFMEERDFGEAQGGITFGEFDAFVGISLDDGTTWRNENLSRSADLSSFTLANGHEYPGDVHALVHQVAEDKIFVAWASKYCASGNPLYALDPLENAIYLTDLENTYGKDAMYLYDLFGVAGTQGSVDYTLQGYPEIGEIPYSCIWTARGKLIAGDDLNTADAVEASHVLWTKPERLTSGARDANLPAVDCAAGAGCILTWQEDPEGLRPGQGLGPGEGWSGAIANAKTDIWYSYISMADFDLVFSDDTDTATAVPIEDYERVYLGTTMPKAYVPMAIPTRLTDNDMCRYDATTEDPYCWIDFDAIDTVNSTNITTFLDGLTGPQAGADFCATSVSWTNPGGATLNLCATEDGRVMMGRVASTRVRLALKPYTPAGAVDLDGDGVVEKSAWLSLAYEETKALGDQLIDPLGNPAVDPLDIGKDVWYHSFDMFDHDFVAQGGMLNQPAKCSPWTVGDTFDCTDYEFFPVQIDPLNGGEYYLTEISRRFAMALNSIPNIVTPDMGGSGLSGMLIFKQGIINQGGPADIFLRRLVYEPTYTVAEDIDGDGQLDLYDEDIDGDGKLDMGEDIDLDGVLDITEDLDGDGVLDVAEDLDGDSVLDEGEDIDGDGKLDVAEDIDGDGKLDVAEDMDGDEILDVTEDLNENGILDAGEDIDGDAYFDDVAEDIDGDGNLDVAEDTDNDGELDASELVIENPYAFENMECAEWAYTDGSNPNYLKGLCMSPAINLSGTTIKTCTAGSDNDSCADAFPVADDGSIPVDVVSFPKVLEWRQCDGVAAIEGCEADSDLDDQSWENPYDIAKGHRGFLDGDYVMMMYAWSPNWKANSVGNDHYNLYVRRSFDGGLTWTTTPADWCDASGACGAGVTALEYYYSAGTDGGILPVPTIWNYDAGAFEQARNVSLLKGNKITILDPRYSPTGGLKQYNTIRTDWLDANAAYFPAFTTDDTLPYDDDLLRDSSKYMMIYETGDNTTVAEGEAVPLDLFYSRATVFGDNYEWYDYLNDTSDGDPVDGVLVPTVDVEPRWPWLENAADDLSGEASVVLNPGGTFSYQVWNQWKEEILPDGEELIYDSDMIFRRLLYLPDGSTVTAKPVASILYQSTDKLSIADDDVLVLVGSGRDIDHVGQGADIINYMWFDDNGAIYCKIDDVDEETGEPIYECEKDTEVKASDMEPGKYHFHFKVQDNELDWSREVTSVEVWVAEDFYDVFLPMTIR